MIFDGFSINSWVSMVCMYVNANKHWNMKKLSNSLYARKSGNMVAKNQVTKNISLPIASNQSQT